MPNLNIGFVTRHPVFLVTFIIAFPAWFIAFIAQCVAEARIANVSVVGGISIVTREPVVRYLWYSIWIQLACIIHLFMAVCTDGLAVHRFQLAIVLAIAEVFAVYGTNFIFSTAGSLIAVGVGWLLLAIVDLVWILYLTSEEESPFYQIFTAGGNGGLSGYNTRARMSSVGYGGEVPRQNGNYGYGYSGVEHTPQKAAREAQSPIAPMSSAPPAAEDKPRAKAMYAYSADPNDPNEVSFAKGEILEVLDNTGKWFQVKNNAGQTGIAPSNYLTLL